MVYFDSAASTKPRSEILDSFLKSNQECFANPSSAHALGREADRRLDAARKKILDAFRLSAQYQVAFLSGATEANNLAIKGVAFSYQNRGKKLLFSAVEHPSVLEPIKYLAEHFGFIPVPLAVDSLGRVSLDTLREAMDKDVILVSIMGANNETGAVNDLASLGAIVHEYPKAFFHSDLTQAIGKMDIPFSSLDLFSYSAHKIHGVKQSGALVYKSSMRLVPCLHGGGQERGLRSGTGSAALDESLALATSLAMSSAQHATAHVRALWQRLRLGLQEEPVLLNSTEEGSPYILNFSLRNHKASVIMEALSQKGFYVSTMSACSERTDQASATLLAMGLPKELAGNAIRVSFSEDNTLEEVDAFLSTLHQILKEVHPR